ncbi:MAG: hypothetical protein JEZ03_00890 [Bacteroidales bacterium]|nr:hypothetical protein [Bacteroidales bacterium]
MKINLKNISRIFVLLLIPTVMWTWYADSSNQHFHIQPDGSIMVHSHPFQADDSKGPVQSHQHSKALLNVLFIVSNFTNVELPAVINAIVLSFILLRQNWDYQYQSFALVPITHPSFRGPPGLFS